MDAFRGRPIVAHELSFGPVRVRMVAPADAEALLDEAQVQQRFEQDEYMPYWASLWPGALLLADEVARWERPAGGAEPAVLELGCGLGLVGVVAALRGWRVTLTDYDEDSLAFAARNAALNGIPDVATRFLDWRETHADLRPARILAADVLYEARHLEPVAAFVARHLERGGMALLSDPGRSTADRFPAVAAEAGLVTEAWECSYAEWPEATRPWRGRIFRLTHAGGAFGGG